MSKPFQVSVLLLLGLVLFHCGKTADEAADAGPTGDAATRTPPTTDAGATDAASAVKDASLTPDAATPPNVSCTTADASACDSIPPSVCAAFDTLVYFSDGACVDGACTWKQTSMQCVQGYCTNGGCTPPTTK